jgi:hypothetical protein
MNSDLCVTIWNLVLCLEFWHNMFLQSYFLLLRSILFQLKELTSVWVHSTYLWIMWSRICNLNIYLFIKINYSWRW